MLFTSYEFLGFILVVFLLYYIVPKKTQWMLLLAASYLFYALADLRYLAFIAATTLSSYAASRLMGRVSDSERHWLDTDGAGLSKDERKAYKAAAKKKRFNILVLALLFNFGILAVLKYAAFAVYNVNSLLHFFGAAELGMPSLLLPMGISFYTFGTMGYLIDAYRGKAVIEKNLFKMALFVSFFPSIVQGPISRFGDLEPQLVSEHRFELKGFGFGVQRILWGYFKKLVIADRALVAVNSLIDSPDKYRGAYVFLLIILYSIQIYADFTGGIDITIGIAESLGIKLTENFNRPFSSRSTKEYWNRWHITMGSWFTDYVFYPISVCRPMLAISKKSRAILGKTIGKRVPVYLATSVTWFLTGVWHGAGWNFIVWGMLNCLVILVSQELEPLYAKFRGRFPRLVSSSAYGAFMAIRTFLLMGLIRSLDCYRNVGLTFSLWTSMLTTFNIGQLFGGGALELGLGASDYLIILAGCAVVFVVSRCGKEKSVRERLYERPVLSAVCFSALFIAVILFGAYSVGYDASQFIYNQF